MSRTQRLLDLLQILRRHRYPIAGAKLAADLDISLRTLYRDIATLKEQGAHIEGDPGLGYVLRPGFTLPPLMFSEDEIEALVLGSRWVANRGDARLSAAARDALAKVSAVLPDALRHASENSTLLVGPNVPVLVGDVDVALIRSAIRNESKLGIAYRDLQGAESTRVIWPFALGFFDQVLIVVAWCELRGDMRHFRVDRIASLTAREERYPKRRHALLKEWREQKNIGQR